MLNSGSTDSAGRLLRRRAKVSTRVFTNWPSNARGASKSAIRKARKRCCCVRTCCRICIALKNPKPLARRLVQQRGLSFDYGLLGDALMEQGKLGDAVEAYQRMMNLKPDLRAYARAAHMRWLKGDLEGAIEAMQLAVSAASPSDAESACMGEHAIGVLRVSSRPC